MPDYAAMYRTLFNAQTDAITLLQQAQQTTEQMYIDAPDPDIRLVSPGKQNEDK
jgi:hypothetical protein